MDKTLQNTSVTQTEHDSESQQLIKLVVELENHSAIENSRLLQKVTTTDNGFYTSYSVTGSLPVKGIMFVDHNPKEKKDKNPIHYSTETYDEYVIHLSKLKPDSTKWIVQIVNGETEQEKVLYRDANFLVCWDWKFDVKQTEDGLLFDPEKLHLLGIPTIEIVPSIRDIQVEHIPLLNEIKEKGLEIIDSVFNIDRSHVKIYFHYPPSTYYLHIHFTHINFVDAGVCFDRAYDYDTVIKNIRLDPNYYRSDLKIISVD